jgi:class 3 adenylate cyclase/HAMP domain-containing protein
MVSKKTKGLLIALACLSLLAAVLCGWQGAQVPLEHVLSTLPAGDTIYVLDQTEDGFRFYETDRTGALKGEIRQKAQRDGIYYSYDALTRDGDTVYVLERQAEIASDLVVAETVCRCNFENRRLEAVWSLPVKDSRQDTNRAAQVSRGVLTCFQLDSSGKEAKATLMQAVAGGELKELTAFSYDIGIGFTDFYVGASGTVAYTTPEGRIYVAAPGEEPRQCFPQGKTDQALVLFANDGEDGVYAAGADGTVYRLDLAGSAEPERVSLPEDAAFSPAEMSAVRFTSDGGYTAARDGEKTLWAYTGKSIVTVHHLAASSGHVALRALLGFAAVWAAAACAVVLRRLFLFLTRGRVPIVTKLLAAFLPILIVSLLGMNALVTGIFEKKLVNGQYERLYLLTAQQTATLDAAYLTEMDPATAFASVHFYELRSALNVLPGQGTLYTADGEQAQEVYNSNYFWLYKMVDGQLVSLICEQDYIGVPVEDRYSAQVAQQFYAAAESGKTCRTAFRDGLGDWTILLTPVKDESGQVVGVIETGDTRQSLDYAVSRGARQLTAVILGTLLVLAALLSVVIAVSLHPLGILKKRVQEISDGHLGVQAPAKGRDEVGEITRVFNTMSRNVEFRDKEIRLTSEGYSRFVPDRVFGLLEKSSVIDVHLEDQTSVEATVLNCSVGAFDDIARSLRSREMFRLINQVLARLVPVVDRSGGLVDRFDRAGLLAIYTDRPDRALDAAVTLCQTLRTSELKEAGGQALEFHVTVSAGPAMIGIVGAEQRLEAMTISEHTSFTSFLRPLAAQYGAAVLVTGSAAALIPDFATRYHVRTLGFVRMRTLDRLERIYDVYDGDDEAVRSRKEETRETFEKGVALFCSHRYYDARLAFIEVLKRHREDKAAKNYLYLCDTYYREDDPEKRDVWIETY